MALLIRRLLLKSSRPLRRESAPIPWLLGGEALLSPSPSIPPFSPNPLSISKALFSSRPPLLDETQVPAAIDYRSVLAEDEYHKLADWTIQDLLEKLEEYGDSINLDGFDIDYGNQVLTLKLGSLGTYVINKQTPNRQIWFSSPVSGPARFDWDETVKSWVYRRTKVNLSQLLEEELEQLCGKPISLS